MCTWGKSIRRGRWSKRYRPTMQNPWCMNRRHFLQGAAALAACSGLAVALEAKPGPEIAFTFDDPRTEGSANLPWQELNERVLRALAKHKVKAALFVCGMRVDSPEGRELLTSWDRGGHIIGNHSYSHLYFNGSGTNGSEKVTLSEFEFDAAKNEPLIKDFTNSTRLFRYPFFKEGDTIEKRDGMRAFLRDRGYRIGRATIDASDWAISRRLERKVESEPKAKLDGYRDYFLEHIWNRSQFYESLAQRVLSHSVRHTVLLHHNALNAFFLDNLIDMFVEKGWKPVNAAVAYDDPVYDRQPKILPAGESLIWALAKETGRFESELRYPGEDDSYENPRMDALNL